VEDPHRTAGEAAYAAGDWDTAAVEFLASVHGRPAEGSGFALHQAGNSLVRLGRLADAATVYERAVLDDTYDRRSAVHANLGAAYGAAGAYEKALVAYTTALADESYPTPYTALHGRGPALYELGRYDEAAQAYRQAAWSDGNPDPGRSFNNLGLSFMAMGRPEEALEAFRAAIGIEGYSAKGKATANLGLAYSTMGFYEEAVREFERSRDAFGHELTGEMLAAYDESQRKAGEEPGTPSAPFEPVEIETVEGWMTGEMPPAIPAASDTGALPDADSEATQRFFDRTDEEIDEDQKAELKAARTAKRTPRGTALRIGLVLLGVLVVAGVFGGLLYAGFGYPTQTQTVSALLDAYRSGASYTEFWVALPQTNVVQEMDQLPAKFSSYRVAGVDRSALSSTVRVIVRFDTGAELSYDILLTREGVGWKVVGVQNAWSSSPN
jgi:tetratricopeptide (TPR) repeat protein